MSHFEARAHAAIAQAEERQEKRGRLRKILILAAPFLALLMFTSVTQREVDDDPGGAVTAARQWFSERPSSYRVTYSRTSEVNGLMGTATVVVDGDEIVSYETMSPALEDTMILTVDRMLLMIEELMVDPGSDVVVANYDPRLGYPTKAVFARAGQVSSTWGFEVVSFEQLRD
jgi:Family of unknown function (DUF6174)